MNTINAIFTDVFQLLLAPLAEHPAWALVVVSSVTGALMTLVFKYVTPQEKLRHVAAQSKAMLMCLRLFKDDLRTALVAQASLLKWTGLRLLYSLPAALVMFIPFVVILTQLALHYEHHPLAPGEDVVLEVQLWDAGWEDREGFALRLPEGVQAETPVLRDEEKTSLSWRITSTAPTSTVLAVAMGEHRYEKQLVVRADTNQLTLVSVRRPGRGVFDRVLYPGEPGFAADDVVQRMHVFYPERDTPILGLNLPWWATFIIVSMIAALVVRPFLRVQF